MICVCENLTAEAAFAQTLFEIITFTNPRQSAVVYSARIIHWGRGYLQQCLNEFDFRYNNRKVSDSERTPRALKAIEGKRLTLRQPRSASA